MYELVLQLTWLPGMGGDPWRTAARSRAAAARKRQITDYDIFRRNRADAAVAKGGAIKILDSARSKVL
eukprot:SAG31_NODE_507_length_14746_cov_5.682119_9_plen_68_part_00